MRDRPLISTYALAMLFRSAGRDLALTLPLKKAGDHLPPAWRLALVGAALRLLVEDSNGVEPPFTPVLTSPTQDSEVPAK
jgi:hypothetical protein